MSFPNLFEITSQPDLDVAHAIADGQWNIDFRRELNVNLLEEWEQLGGLLSDVYLSEGRDEVSLSLERSHKYTTRSLYRLMTSGGVVDYQMMVIWKTNIPLKVKIFMWMAVHDRIQCGVQLKRKQWSCPKECFVCDKPETTGHILFQCPMAVFLWSFLYECLGWPSSPTSC